MFTKAMEINRMIAGKILMKYLETYKDELR
jgi:hypothetical protein